MVRSGFLPRLALVPLLIVAVGLVVWHPGQSNSISSGLEGKLLDLRFWLRGPIEPPAELAIVAIDDESLAKLERFPVPRRNLAEAVRLINGSGARVIALDLLLPSEEAASPFQSVSPGDAALATALNEADHAILAAASFGGEEKGAGARLLGGPLSDSFYAVISTRNGAGLPIATNLLMPLKVFAEMAKIGHVNVDAEADGSLRFVPVALSIGDGLFLPALSLQAVFEFLGVDRSEVRLELGTEVAIADRLVPVNARSAAALNYYGPSGTIPTYSLTEIATGAIGPNELDGKLVFLGATASGFGDVFATPFDRQMPGVETLATFAGNALDGSALIRNDKTWVIDLVLAIIVVFAVFWSAGRPNGTIAILATAGIWVTGFALVQFAFGYADIWLDAVTLVCVMLLTTGTTFLGRMVTQGATSRRLSIERGNLAQYVSPLIAEKLAKTGRPGLGDNRHVASILFVDVIGFTTRSERLGPEKTVEFLRILHGMIERSSLEHDGVIEHFQGDGAMIVFGLMEPHSSDPVSALECAKQMLDASKTLLTATMPNEPELQLRISLNAGPVVTAVLGGERQGQLTVAGDTVNSSSRLQDVAKENGVALALSDAFVSAVKEAGEGDLIEGLTPLPPQKLRGREEAMTVWIGTATALSDVSSTS